VPQAAEVAKIGLLNRSYLALLSSQVISMLGTQFSNVALPWFVLSTTGSPAKMSFVILAFTLPLALFGIPAGALVDRFNKKRLMIFCDLVRGVFMLAIPLLENLGLLEFWMILLAGFLGGILTTPYLSARMALIPVLVGEETEDLTRANTALQVGTQLTIIMGPALAGILINVLGNVNVLFLDAASFIIAGIIIAFGVRYTTNGQQSAPSSDWIAEVRAGLGFMWNHQIIRTIILIGAFVTLGIQVTVSAVLPVFVKDVLHAEADQLGWLLSVGGVGSLVGMVAYGAFIKRLPWSSEQTVARFLIGLVLPFWLLPLAPGFLSAFIGLGISFVFAAPIFVIIQTILQTATPVDLRGRVFAAFNALWQLVTPLGLLFAGPLLEGFGAMLVVWLIAIMMTICLIAAFLSPVVRGTPVGSKSEG